MEAIIDADRQVGDLVGDEPAMARVFEAMGIDYCCDGDITLAAACASADLDVSAVHERMTSVRDDGDRPGEDLDPLARDEWDSMSELVDHVVAVHHDFLRGELEPLGTLAGDVVDAHGESHPELQDLQGEFTAIETELREHMQAEEADVFPVVERLDAGESLTRLEAQEFCEHLEALEDDHDAVAEHFDRITRLTNGYDVPDDGCERYRELLYRLKRLERDTRRHVHKENNLLFPEAEARLEPDS